MVRTWLEDENDVTYAMTFIVTLSQPNLALVGDSEQCII